jgi:orotate phosphoribosyltransferase
VTPGTPPVEQLFADLGVLRTGHFKLSSGKHSDTYLQCALALQQPDVALDLGRRLAALVADREPDVVVSPALGGVLAGFVVAAALGCRFAFTERAADRSMSLRRGQHVAPGERVVVVEDVVTTGGSAREAADVVTAHGGQVVGYATLVDRSAGLPAEQRPTAPPAALLRLTPATWDPDACPRCAAGDPLDAPGSRHTGQS